MEVYQYSEGLTVIEGCQKRDIETRDAFRDARSYLLNWQVQRRISPGVHLELRTRSEGGNLIFMSATKSRAVWEYARVAL